MRKRVFVFAGLFFLLLAAVVIVAGILVGRNRLEAMAITADSFAAQPGTYRVTVEHGGRERDYIAHLPPQVASGAPLPLLLAPHGGGGRASHMDDLTHLASIADREGFLAVYPDAIDRNWNDGRPDSGSKAAEENIDDVGFLRAVIADVSARVAVDPSRVYAAGISNGAIMSNRLACEASDVIAAVGLVVGTAPVGFESWCAPGRPVPLISFLATDDPLVPFDGGEISAIFGIVKRGKVVSAAGLTAFWTSNNGCGPDAAVSALPDASTADDSTVERHTWAGCEGGAEVVLYRLEGAGHTWPGGKQYLSPWLVGTTNRDIDASKLMWDFFRKHSLP
jgi:polyhydroxybutyrate depolymerase